MMTTTTANSVKVAPCDIEDPALPAAFSAKATRYATLGLTTSAEFFHDKASFLTSTPTALLTQARHLFSTSQPRRALHLLQTNDLPTTLPAARLLAAQCLYALSDLESALALLPDEITDPTTNISTLTLSTAPDEVIASACVLSATIHERLENPTRALQSYQRALRADYLCIDAFQALASHHLAPPHVISAFLDSLPVPAGPLAAWVAAYYRATLDRSCPLPAPAASDSQALVAARCFASLDFAGCVQASRSLLKRDAFPGGAALETYLAALVELDERHELFVAAHRLVDAAPRAAVSWLAVGYYYLCAGKPDAARRFLQKSTALDARLAAGWVAFGHAFGAQDESDQAMAAYRTAARLFPGAQMPGLFMGMEYARQSSLGHAATLFQSAREAYPNDPAPRHELGVVAYRLGDMARAVAYFKAALSLWEASDGTRLVPTTSGRRAEAEEATLFNLGHCYRRLREFPRARRCYERALGLRPRCASTCTALGMTLHGMRDMRGAVAMYHRALRYSPDDANCAELLERGLEDLFSDSDSATLIVDGDAVR